MCYSLIDLYSMCISGVWVRWAMLMYRILCWILSFFVCMKVNWTMNRYVHMFNGFVSDIIGIKNWFYWYVKNTAQNEIEIKETSIHSWNSDGCNWFQNCLTDPMKWMWTIRFDVDWIWFDVVLRKRFLNKSVLLIFHLIWCDCQNTVNSFLPVHF